MNPILKDIQSSDFDLRNFDPSTDSFFNFWVTASIGTKESDGGDNFQFNIVGIDYIASEIKSKGSYVGKKVIIVDDYSYDIIYQSISEICKGISEATWEAIGKKIGTFGHWEFDEYIE